MENVDSQASFSRVYFWYAAYFWVIFLIRGCVLKKYMLIFCVVVGLEYTLICNINIVCVCAHILCWKITGTQGRAVAVPSFILPVLCFINPGVPCVNFLLFFPWIFLWLFPFLLWLIKNWLSHCYDLRSSNKINDKGKVGMSRVGGALTGIFEKPVLFMHKTISIEK